MKELANDLGSGDALWEIRKSPVPDGPVLVILPHAGGNAHYYAQWESNLPARTGLLVAQYPGRGSRFIDDLAENIGDLAAPIISFLAEQPFAPVIMGHSMGTLVAYEVARGLTELGRPPLALIGSACRAPYLPNPAPVLPQTLSDEELVEAIKSRGGTDNEILDEPEMWEIILPSIRADFAIDDVYRSPDAVRTLSCPITIVGGESDPIVPVLDLVSWREVTEGESQVETIPGGHFYFDESVENMDRFMSIVDSTVTSVMPLRVS